MISPRRFHSACREQPLIDVAPNAVGDFAFSGIGATDQTEDPAPAGGSHDLGDQGALTQSRIPLNQGNTTAAFLESGYGLVEGA